VAHESSLFVVAVYFPCSHQECLASHGGEFEQTVELIGLWNRFKLGVILLGQLIA
jgi:hypothetical protein